MVLLKPRRRPEQASLLAACATSRPAPAERPRGVDPKRTPLPLGAPARSVAVLADLRAADGTLGMRRPSAPVPAAAPPLPSRDLIEYVTAVSTAIHADHLRHLDTLRVIDDIAAVLTEHSELLAPPSHPGPRLWLRRIAAELAPYTKSQVA